VWNGLAVAALPTAAGLLFLDAGFARNIIISSAIVAWIAWSVLVWAVGTVFIAKKTDRYSDRKVRPKLSKEYRKR
jgi:hypothetical protein